MAFKHGIGTTETPTAITAIKVDGITPVYVGTAPINLCEEKNCKPNTVIKEMDYQKKLLLSGKKALFQLVRFLLKLLITSTILSTTF